MIPGSYRPVPVTRRGFGSERKEIWAPCRNLERIVKDPEIRFGRPVIKGTRISVADVLGRLAAGDEIADVLDAFPQLSQEDIYASLAYAADREALARIA